MVEKQPKDNDAPNNSKNFLFLGAGVILIVVLFYFLKTPSTDKEDVSDVRGTSSAVEDEDESKYVFNSGDEEDDYYNKPENDVKDIVQTAPMDDTDPTEEDSTEADPEEEPELPDLYIKEITFDHDPKQNEEVTAQIEIGNKGEATARDFYWEWWPTEDDAECEDDIDELADGDEVVVECSYTYTEHEEYVAKAIVDTDGDVDEEDEDNNELEIEVEPEEEMKADLVITEYSFDPVPETDVPFTVRIGVTNEGNLASGPFMWEWWGTAYAYACREQISELAPNSTKVVTCDYLYGGWSTYPTKAVVDADGDVDEFDEDNNDYVENVVPIHTP